jgi:hypothetical protein
MLIVVIRYQQIRDLDCHPKTNMACLALGLTSSSGISLMGNFQVTHFIHEALYNEKVPFKYLNANKSNIAERGRRFAKKQLKKRCVESCFAPVPSAFGFDGAALLRDVPGVHPRPGLLRAPAVADVPQRSLPPQALAGAAPGGMLLGLHRPAHHWYPTASG